MSDLPNLNPCIECGCDDIEIVETNNHECDARCYGLNCGNMEIGRSKADAGLAWNKANRKDGAE